METSPLTEPEAPQMFRRDQVVIVQTEPAALYDQVQTDPAPVHLYSEPDQAVTTINHQVGADLQDQITETGSSAGPGYLQILLSIPAFII